VAKQWSAIHAPRDQSRGRQHRERTDAGGRRLGLKAGVGVREPPTVIAALDQTETEAPPAAARQAAILRRAYPEIEAGGFTRVSGTIEFYTRVNALLPQHAAVLDFGAGRAAWFHSHDPYSLRLRTLRDRATRVVGVDVDPAVRENPALTEVHVIAPAEPLPFEEGVFDLILADCVFEHLGDPGGVIAEFHRVLRPGGWVCARTPNLLHPIGLAAYLAPHRWQRLATSRLQAREQRDVFPTTYRLNTRRALRRWFPPAAWRLIVYGWTAEPAYYGESRLLFALMRMLDRALPEACSANLFAFARKR
jgi:SAM-dependent methyltransferase